MKITIITATKNNAKTLERTITSVINQSYADIDYIIVDGMSTDNSIDIIKKWASRYPEKIRYIREPDSGVYQAINKGISMADGEIIGVLHGNDFFSSDDVVQRVATIMDEEKVPFVYGDIHYEDKKGRIVRYYSSDNYDCSMLKMGIAPPHPSFYVRKSLFNDYGTYKEDYLIGADFELFVRFMLVNGLQGQYIPMDMVTMTTGGLSTRLYHQIITNNREKYRALKENSISVCPFLLLKRYLYNLKSLFGAKRK